MSEEDKIICRCEEVTEKEIREAIREGHVTLKSIKKRTRAGMGLCQGRTCSSLIRKILVEMTGKSPDEFQPDRKRFPVKPVKIRDLAGSKD